MPKRPAHHRVKRHDVYTLAEAAERVGVHRKTVARWVRDRGLPADTSRKPDGAIADYEPRTERSGLLIGLCPTCGRLMHRIVRHDDLARKAAGIEVAFR